MGTRTVAFMLVGRDDTYENFRSSVLPSTQRTDLRDLLNNLPAGDRERALATFGNDGSVPSMWGIHEGQKSVWSELRRGDVVFFLRKGAALGWAVVRDKVVSASLAEDLWGRDPRTNNVFSNILLMEPFTPHRVAMTEVRAILGWKPNANLRQNGIGRRGREQQLLKQALPQDAAKPLIASSLLPEGVLSAEEYLDALLGQELTTPSGARNTILSMSNGTVLVATSRSPDGQPVPVQELQTALEELAWLGALRVTPSELGYRSTFVGTVLGTLEKVEVEDADGVALRVKGFSTDDWSDREVRILVSEYVTMLKAQLRGEAFVKAEHNRRVRTLVANRTRPSVEFKLRNVSFVLDEMGLPWVQGYVPASNRQYALVAATTDALDADEELQDLLRSELPGDPGGLGEPEVEAVFTPPPPPQQGHGRVGGIAVPGLLGGNDGGAALGLDGEKWVCDVERARLTQAGHSEFAARVTHVSQTQGDGLGYDVLSFNEDGSPRRIEVKTTTGGASKPFLVSPNEVRKSSELASEYYLYRVFDFARRPRVWVMPGDLSENFNLEASQYSATVR